MIVATAGHIDHGKTALVKALTGVDTDRLPEEKARGISIELGFAYVPLPGGGTLGFVDVPGHERFVRTMIAGACGIDFALLVVAADDGVMPQTREHLAIVDLLGVTRGVVAVTKVDAVPASRLAAVREEIRALLAGTALADAPVHETSSITGAGIDALRSRLIASAESHSRDAVAHRRFRYAVDRAFTVAGSGTVVTGTVFNGTVTRGERLTIVPAGVVARVRGIQMAGEPVDQAQAGERCALNLAGVERERVARGQWLAADDTITTRIEGMLRVLADAPPVVHGSCVHLHLGTADVEARIGIVGGASIAPGGSGFVQVTCSEPVCAVVGDRFIVRDPSARRTLGGGTVVDPLPPSRRVLRPLRDAHRQAMAALAPEPALASLLAHDDSGVDIERFGRAFGLEPGYRDQLVEQSGAVIVEQAPPLVFSRATVNAINNAAVAALTRFHAESPRTAGMELAALRPLAAPGLRAGTFAALMREIAADAGIEIVGSLARRAGHVSTANRADQVLWQKVNPRLAEAGFRGVSVADLARDLRLGEAALSDFLHRKASSGELVRVTAKRFYTREVFHGFARLAADLAAASPGEDFTAATFRDHAGVNRTHAIEILECLDRLGVTQRIGDARKMRAHSSPNLEPAPTAHPAPVTPQPTHRRDARRV
jgi:selenocysteine-specific elongation factor